MTMEEQIMEKTMEEQTLLSDALLALYGQPGDDQSASSCWDSRSVNCHDDKHAAVADTSMCIQMWLF